MPQSILKKAKFRASVSASILFTGAALQSVAWAEDDDSKKQQSLEVIKIFGSTEALEKATGSANLIDNETLEQFEYDDIHQVLRSIPGVYIREEDAYGLRPNIGLRGATTERSSKIALMEDGILLAPAPYSAPAAYYFPSISRMQSVEVFKGPAAIRFGPNTVGGAINMLSTEIQESGTGKIDVALGQQAYRKAHANYSYSMDGFDILVEGIHFAADGFKDLPNNQNTGFEKNEFLSKIAYEIKDSKYYQRWLFKIGASNEVSDETYLGLSDADFAIKPNQRYAASSLDELDWEHSQMSLSHYVEWSDKLTMFTQGYYREFDRDWDRLNRFVGSRPISTILASPSTGLNSLFYEVLTGQRDSLTDDETLVQTLNDRNYYSQGIQTKFIYEEELDWADLRIDMGIRLHQDQVKRLHRDKFFVMRSGELNLSTQAIEVTANNRDKVTAIAAYLDSVWQWDKLTASAGVRLEKIDADAQDNLLSNNLSSSDTVILPGLGVFYEFNQYLGILAGINKGFVPNSPGQSSDIAPEESWNYELGFRGSLNRWSGSLIGFFNDYKNLKGSCTFSSGCLLELDQEFNGGEVNVIGLEFEISRDFEFDGFVLPIKVAYTHTQSEFQTSFESEFSQWGDVSKGDELPYIPNNQLSIIVGIEKDQWRASLAYKYVDEMLEAAGSNTDLSGFVTEPLSQIDLSGWYQFSNALKMYVKIDNLSDKQTIVSRRPFGARPNKPRQAIVGLKYTF